MSTRPDVVVLGSEIEGLVTAACLARAGKRVVVLERRATPGGRHAREEFHPGFRASGVWPGCELARRSLLDGLGLERHGLTWCDEEPALLVPDPSGCPLLYRRDPARHANELPPGEAERLAALRAFLAKLAPLAAGLLDEAPPAAARPSAQELLGLAGKALRLRLLGRAELFTLARVLPSSARDWMEEALGMEAARVALVAPALAGTVLGPRAPGTSLFVFLREALAGPEPAGGPGALIDALVALCGALGVTLRTEADVRRIHVGPDGVRAVELAGGETIDTPRVASALAPARTLLELLPAGTLALSVERAAQSFRTRGATAVLRLALRSAPVFAGRTDQPVEHAVSARSLDELERAADALKYGVLPESPWVEVRVPSRADPALAPAGQAVAVVACHTVPHVLAAGWNAAARARLEQALLAAFERIAPGVGATVVGRELLTPVDIETRYGAPGGHLHDGELALDQLWLQRPSLVLSRYATPVPGLFLCGAGAHPGGPFLGGAGTLAARALVHA